MRPLTNAMGSRAAITVNVAKMVGPPTSSTACGMMSLRLRPGCSSWWRWMFSTTTMASSTRMPIEKISANSDTRLRVKAQGQEDECHHRRCCEQQLLDELLGLVVGGGAVVAGFRHLHAVGNHGVVQ